MDRKRYDRSRSPLRRDDEYWSPQLRMTSSDCSRRVDGEDNKKVRLIVSNLPFDARWQDVKDFCNHHVGGGIGNVQLIEKSDGRPSGAAAIDVRGVDFTERIIHILSNVKMKGRRLYIREETEKGILNYRLRDVGELKSNGDMVGGGGAVGAAAVEWEDTGVDGMNIMDLSLACLPLLTRLGVKPETITNQVFVANIIYTITVEELADVFRMAGRVNSIDILSDKEGNPRGAAIVRYENPIEAVQAIAMFNNQSLNGRQMTVRMDRLSGSIPQSIPDRLPSGLETFGMGLGASGQPIMNISFLSNILTLNSLSAMMLQNTTKALAATGGSNFGSLLDSDPRLSTTKLNGDTPASTTLLTELASHLGLSRDVLSLLNNCKSIGGVNSLIDSRLRSDDRLLGDAEEQGSRGFRDRGSRDPGSVDRRSRGSRDRGLRSEGFMERGFVDRESRDRGSRNRGSREGRSRDPDFINRRSIDRVSRDRRSRDRSSRDRRWRDRGSLDQRSRDRGSRNCSPWDGVVKDLGSMDQGSQNGGSRDRGTRDHRGSRDGRSQEHFSAATLVIKNLPYSFTWPELKDRFRVCGDIRYADIMHDEQGRSLGEGTIRFSNVSDAKRAIQMMHGNRIDDRTIEVKFLDS